MWVVNLGGVIGDVWVVDLAMLGVVVLFFGYLSVRELLR